MKRILLSFSIVLFAGSVAMAQSNKEQLHMSSTGVHAAATQANNVKPEDMVFNTDTHDFGTVPEGPAASYEFTFKNKSKEPIILQHVQASCGCTTPTYSKEPVLPGKDGIIKASYNTQGRPGNFDKKITVVSNAGTKVLTIKGEVEKAPTSSVPENNSMIKTN
ncbi:MAG: DUF1573 domain-containing protein [Flavipsychrobacter sp.]